jgi:hypothetical protein
MKTFYVLAKVTVRDDDRFEGFGELCPANLVAGYLEGVLSNGMSACDQDDQVLDLSVMEPETDPLQCRDLEEMLTDPDWPRKPSVRDRHSAEAYTAAEEDA